MWAVTSAAESLRKCIADRSFRKPRSTDHNGINGCWLVSRSCDKTDRVGSAASLLRGTGTFRGDQPREGWGWIQSFLMPVTVKDSCDPRHEGPPAAQTLHCRRLSPIRKAGPAPGPQRHTPACSYNGGNFRIESYRVGERARPRSKRIFARASG